MKLQDLLEELQEKPEYKTFQVRNPDTFFAAAFLILNLEQKTEQKCQAQRTNSKEVHIRGTLVPGIIQLDYFLPKENKIAAFEFPFTEPKIHDNIISIEKGQTTKAKPIPMQKQTTEIKPTLNPFLAALREQLIAIEVLPTDGRAPIITKSDL